MSHKGRPVKWIGADTGWKTGHVVAPMGKEVREGPYLLVQHSCDGAIERVDAEQLEPWLSRDEWEVESE
jgi:hypothetical protein